MNPQANYRRTQGARSQEKISKSQPRQNISRRPCGGKYKKLKG